MFCTCCASHMCSNISEDADSLVQMLSYVCSQEACSLLAAALKSLLVVLAWAPLSQHVMPALLEGLIAVVQAAAAQPDEEELAQCGADAVMCITEVHSHTFIRTCIQSSSMTHELRHCDCHSAHITS